MGDPHINSPTTTSTVHALLTQPVRFTDPWPERTSTPMRGNIIPHAAPGSSCQRPEPRALANTVHGFIETKAGVREPTMGVWVCESHVHFPTDLRLRHKPGPTITWPGLPDSF